VGDYVVALSLGQYRKKFMHHVVDGRLLLRMTDALLRTELGIGPLVRRKRTHACVQHHVVLQDTWLRVTRRVLPPTQRVLRP
jgi:hypothetical protein